MDTQQQSQISPTGQDLAPLGVSKKREELGASGTSLSMGYITEDYNSKFNGSNKHDTYQQMYLSDSTVFKTVLSCELPIRSAERTIKPYTNSEGYIDPKDKEVADFVKKALFEKLEFDQFLFEVLSYLRHGFSVFEKVYMVEDGKVWIKKLGFRKQKSVFQRQTENGQPGIQQYLYDAPKDGPNKDKTYLSIPANKLLIFSFRREGDNYEGISILRPIAKNRFIKDQLEKFETVKHERQSVGVPIGYMADSASPADKLVMQNIVENVRANESGGIVMPGSKNSGRLFEFADLKANQDTGLAESIKRHDTAITDIMLGLFMKLGGEGKTGSYGMAESQLSFFILGLASIAKQICGVINNYLIKELVDMNFEVENYPTITFGEIGSVDVQKITTAAASLVSAGLLSPDENLEQFMRKILDLPPKTEQEDEGMETEDEEMDDEETDGEIGDLEGELDDLDKEMGGEETDDETGGEFCDVAEKLLGLYNKVSIFRAPMSDETKKKISEALKKGGAEDQDISNRQKNIDDVDAEIERIKAKISKRAGLVGKAISSIKNEMGKIPQGKAGKAQRQEMRKKISEVRANLQKMREDQKKIIEEKKRKRDILRQVNKEAKSVNRENKKQARKAEVEKKRSIREADRERRKAEREAKRRNKFSELAFDQDYFNNISRLINNDFITKLQSE